MKDFSRLFRVVCHFLLASINLYLKTRTTDVASETRHLWLHVTDSVQSESNPALWAAPGGGQNDRSQPAFSNVPVQRCTQYSPVSYLWTQVCCVFFITVWEIACWLLMRDDMVMMLWLKYLAVHQLKASMLLCDWSWRFTPHLTQPLSFRGGLRIQSLDWYWQTKQYREIHKLNTVLRKPPTQNRSKQNYPGSVLNSTQTPTVTVSVRKKCRCLECLLIVSLLLKHKRNKRWTESWNCRMAAIRVSHLGHTFCFLFLECFDVKVKCTFI